MKTIKKREKPIIAPETELMNCRREEQRVYLISQRRQRINAMAPKTWTEIVNSCLQDEGTNYKVPMKNFNLEAENASGPLNADAIFLGKNLFGNILKN